MQKKNRQLLIFRATSDVVKDKEKIKPYRDIAILENQSLSTLARAIVDAFGFDFDHCYGFYDNLKDIYKSKEIYELFTDLGEDPTPGALGVDHTKITQAFPVTGKTMKFLFDYGDDWQFTVILTDKKTADSKIKYPEVVSSFGEAPLQYPPYEEEDFEFDDCAICQGMKKAKEKGHNLSSEELKELFDKQNRLNKLN